jgi:hypothetical protein
MSTHKRDKHFLRKVISLHLLGRPTLTVTIPVRHIELETKTAEYDVLS